MPDETDANVKAASELADGIMLMPSHFDLIITADSPNRTAELRLLDAHGSQLACRH